MEPKLLTTGTAPTLQKKISAFQHYKKKFGFTGSATHIKNRFAAASTVIPISIFIRSDGTVCPPPLHEGECQRDSTSGRHVWAGAHERRGGHVYGQGKDFKICPSGSCVFFFIRSGVLVNSCFTVLVYAHLLKLCAQSGLNGLAAWILSECRNS